MTRCVEKALEAMACEKRKNKKIRVKVETNVRMQI